MVIADPMRYSAAPSGARESMTRNNMLYLLVGALAVVAAILAWNLYQAKKQPDGVQINVGPGGLTIEKK